ncbi:hypothetical protein ACPF04_05920 [Campylobacter sp. MOP51]|uniref:hypothetical protein n=1 Tax=Campylobacter canis TaxID=3378588 RepID=UPI003C4C1382
MNLSNDDFRSMLEKIGEIIDSTYTKDQGLIERKQTVLTAQETYELNCFIMQRYPRTIKTRVYKIFDVLQKNAAFQYYCGDGDKYDAILPHLNDFIGNFTFRNYCDLKYSTYKSHDDLEVVRMYENAIVVETNDTHENEFGWTSFSLPSCIAYYTNDEFDDFLARMVEAIKKDHFKNKEKIVLRRLSRSFKYKRIFNKVRH